MATIDTLTAAFVTAINDAAVGGQTYTAIESYLPRIERKNMGSGWHVWVVSSDLASQRITRAKIRQEPHFDVGMLKLLPDTTAGSVGPCLRFVDQVQLYVGQNLQQLDSHDLISSDFDPLYSEAHLRQQSVFMSVLSITYRRHGA